MPTNKVLDLVLSGDFASADPWDVTASEWAIAGGVANWVSDGTDDTMSQDTIALVDGKTCKVGFTVTNTSLTGAAFLGIQLGGGTAFPITADGTYEIYLVSGSSISSGLEITAVGGTAGDTMTFDDISVIVEQFKTSTNLDAIFVTNAQTVNAGADIGPIDEYPSNGTQGGKVKYTSDGTHPDGTGGAPEAWDLWWDGSTDWIISPDAGTKGANHWKLTQASPIGTYTAVGDVTGAAEVTFGPTDHATATGPPAMETDPDNSGSITIKTAFDFLNDLRAGKFAIVQVFEIDSTSANNSRAMSAETSSGVGYRFEKRSGTNIIRHTWSGTNVYDSGNVTVIHDTLHNSVVTFDIANTRGFLNIDGVLEATDTNASGLDAVQNSMIRMGARSDAANGFVKAKFAFTAFLDLSAVATVDATWSTGLSVAINNAGTDATAIANAIFAYDANITGFYWPLNEANSGDTSDYYLLARDITDDSEQTGSFYGLVSPSGVTGTTVKQIGGLFGRTGDRRARYKGVYRPRYNF